MKNNENGPKCWSVGPKIMSEMHFSENFEPD